jgi:hypothetical protein
MEFHSYFGPLELLRNSIASEGDATGLAVVRSPDAL